MRLLAKLSIFVFLLCQAAVEGEVQEAMKIQIQMHRNTPPFNKPNCQPVDNP